MIVAVVAMTLTSALWGSLVLLLRPVLEGMVGQMQREHQTAAVAPASQSEEPQEIADPVSEGVEEVKGKIGEKIRQWGPIRNLLEYVGPGPEQLAHIAVVIVALIAPLWVIFAFLETFCTERVIWKTMASVRVTVFERLSRLPLAFFAGRRTGDLISRLTNDISTTRGAAKMLFKDVFKHPIQILVFLSIAFYHSWLLTLVVIAVAPIIGLVMSRYGKRIQRHGRKTLERFGDITEAISQMFSGIRVVKSFGMEEQEVEEFRERNQRQVSRAMKLVRDRAWADSLPQAAAAIGIGALLFVAQYLINKQMIDIKTLVVVVAAVSAVPRSLKRIVKVYSKLRQNLGAFERIFELVDQQTTIQDAPDAAELKSVDEDICFNHVWFAYEDEDYVLKDIDLEVEAGTVCALVGETGAGKSTMLDLIPRFYDPLRGAVEIDGQDLRNVSHESLLNQIAIVGQHPFLFNRTVEENIRYGRRDASQDDVIAAAKAAQAHEFVSSLPEGYNTVVGEKGSRFSGGQRQCITIARALLKDAPILILDEATSNLDSESEQQVQKALEVLMEGRTTFVIAHRLSTVRFADRIVVLKNGRIVEHGSHSELLKMRGEYAKLHRIQFSQSRDNKGEAANLGTDQKNSNSMSEGEREEEI